MKQLLIGPRKFRNSLFTGGEVVLFENWIEWCEGEQHPFIVVDANKANYTNILFAIVSIYWQILSNARQCDVVFLQGSKNDFFFIAPWAALVAKLFGKPFFLRKFAGEFDKDYNRAPKWKKWGISWAMKQARCLFFEVKRLLPFGRQFNNNCQWFPNTRKRPTLKRSCEEKYDKKKFVFVSQVRKEKGVDEMLEAFRKLGPEYGLDIYGPLIGYTPDDLDGHYKGCLRPEQVEEILPNYLLLLLSSWKEGYPGIIIEAFGAGLPVIASKAGGIPEMIEDGVNGILCESHSADEIVQAIKRMESIDFHGLSNNAAASFDTYDSDKVNSKVYKELANSMNL